MENLPTILSRIIEYYELTCRPDFGCKMYIDVYNELIASRSFSNTENLTPENFCFVVYKGIPSKEVPLRKKKSKKKKTDIPYGCSKVIITKPKQQKKKIELHSVASDSFLDSFEWKQLRIKALILHGRKCQCCGAFPEKDNKVVLNVDHIKPRKYYPELALDINNLQVLCSDCNHGKGNWCKEDFR